MKKENPLFECERKRSQRKKLVQCSKCSAFYSRTYFARHKKLCVAESTSEPQGLPISLLTNCDTSAFEAEVLASFSKDSIGKLCQTDEAILQYGRRTYDKLKGKQDKKAELRGL